MTDTNYTTTFTVNEEPSAVFAAINNVRGWWSEDVEGYTTNTGDVWFYEAPNLHRCTLKVIDSIPGKKVAWRVLDNSFSFIADKAEWIGTTMVFEIERNGTQTRLTFTHVGLVPAYECYDVCHDAWGTYINGSLKALITTSKGQPNAGSEVTAKAPEASFTTAFNVAQSPEAAFAAIVNPRAWWSGDHQGMSDRVGDVFTYRYKNLHYSKQEVTELVPGQRVAWHVTDGRLAFVESEREWVDTTITFDIARHGNSTQVVFTHVGLKPAGECYDTCSDAWTALIQGSLKQLIETGKTDMLELDGPAA